MQMTPGEIRRDYRLAANKDAQIGILADLNCTTKDNIRKILNEKEPGEAVGKQQGMFGSEYQMRRRMDRLSEDELTEQYVRHITAIHIIADALEQKVKRGETV